MEELSGFKMVAGDHLEQGLKLSVFMDWELRRDVALVLPVHHQRFGSCDSNAPNNVRPVTSLEVDLAAAESPSALQIQPVIQE